MNRATARNVIEDAYQALLLRPADPGGLEHWIRELAENQVPVSKFFEFLLQSKEFADKASRVLHHHVSPAHLPFMHDNSQNGEVSALLKAMLGRSVRAPVLVDVGAHGRFGSNSYDLLRHFGWKGLLIEPNPWLHEALHREFAGTDYELCPLAAADHAGDASFHLGVDPEISSLHRTATEHWGPISDIIKVRTETLPAILRQYRIPTEFGLLSVDAEGEGLNLVDDAIADGFKPDWMIIEVFEGLKIGSLGEVPIGEPVRRAYRIAARTFANLILERIAD
jgi:FkbM family methyltransferase